MQSPGQRLHRTHTQTYSILILPAYQHGIASGARRGSCQHMHGHVRHFTTSQATSASASSSRKPGFKRRWGGSKYQPLPPTDQPRPTQFPPSLQDRVCVSGVVKKKLYGPGDNNYYIVSVTLSSARDLASDADVTEDLSTLCEPAYPNQIVAAGALPNIHEGQPVAVYGKMILNQSKGWQLRAEYYEPTRPQDPAMIQKYLPQFLPGVGPGRAATIVNFYGARTFEVLDSPDAAQKLMKIRGIGKGIASDIKRAWDGTNGQHKVQQLLTMELQLGPRLANEIIKALSGGRKDVALDEASMRAGITTDPWHYLSQFRAAGWKVMEQVAQLVGAPLDHPSRAQAALQACLRRACQADSHTHLPWPQLQLLALQLMSQTVDRGWPAGPEGLAMAAVDLMMPQQSSGRSRNAGMVVVTWEQQQGQPPRPRASSVAAARGELTPQGALSYLQPDALCYLSLMWRAERKVGEALCGMVRSYVPMTELDRSRYSQEIAALQQRLAGPDGQPLQLSEGQVAAVMLAAHSPVSLITGGPGCGKTFVTRAIVRYFKAKGCNVRLCAPTGRAAQRMAELVSHSACTVHRLLGYKPGSASSEGDSALESADDEDAGGLEDILQRCNPHSLAEADVVLVDESSMLELTLAEALLTSLRPGCRLVLVGDPDQLPPVGAGELLRDAVASGLLPSVDMRQIFRQAAGSKIVEAAHKVIQGSRPDWGYWHRWYDVQQRSWYDPVQAYLQFRGDQLQQGLQPASPEAVFLQLPREASSADVEEQVLAVVQHLLPQLGYDTRAELQVLSPTKRLPGGVHSLNIMLQQVLNPEAQHLAEMPLPAKLVPRHLAKAAASDQGGSGPKTVWRVGDRVLHLKNNADEDIYNGDQGWLVSAEWDAKQLVVRYPSRAQGRRLRLQEQRARQRAQEQQLAQQWGERSSREESDGSSSDDDDDWQGERARNSWDSDADGSGGPPALSSAARELSDSDEDAGSASGSGSAAKLELGRVSKESRAAAKYVPEMRLDLTYAGADVAEQLSLAWATTVHKAQGGEAPAVVVALHHNFGNMLLNRRLLYTAVTRAKQLLVVVGTERALDTCLAQAQGADRLSTLPLQLAYKGAAMKLPQLPRQVFRGSE